MISCKIGQPSFHSDVVIHSDEDASLADNGAQSAVDKSIQDIEDHQCLIILGPFVNDEKTSINNLNPIPDRQCYELSLRSAIIVREFNSQVAIQVLKCNLVWSG